MSQPTTQYVAVQDGVIRFVYFTVGDKTIQYSYKQRFTQNLYSKTQDQWEYTLPNGTRYSHPTEHGCLHMILKYHFSGENK